MYDLTLTDEQREIQETIRDFVEREVKPATLASARLEDLSRPLDLDATAAAAALGLRAFMLPESIGGAGADTLTACLAMEELGAGDAGIAVTLAHTALLAGALFDGALDDTQRARLLPRFLEDDRFHLAFAPVSNDADAELHYHEARPAKPSGGPRARRDRRGDWVVDGTTGWAVNLPVAGRAVVDAVQEDGQPLRLLVTPGGEGTRVEAMEVVRGAPTAEGSMRRWAHGSVGRLVLEGCRVPAGDVLGGTTPRLEIAAAAAWASPLFPAINLGIARAAHASAVEYAGIRVQGGRRIIEHQALGGLVADCAIELESARNMVHKAAWAHDHPDSRGPGEHPAGILHTMARVHTARIAYDVTLRSAECFGAMGVMLDMPLARYMQDARIFLHAGRSASVGRLRIAESLAGYAG